MRCTGIVLSALLVLTIANRTLATEYHLYPGNSIGSALSTALPGDILTLHPGTAGQTFDRPGNQSGRNGTANAWITIRGAPGEARPRIYYSATDKNMIDLTNCNYLKWQHLEIQGGSDGFKFSGTCHDILIEDCYIHHLNDVGVNASGITELYNLTVRDCEIAYTNYTGEGFYLGKHGSYTGKQVHDSLIERNYIHDIRTSQGQGDGIELKHGCNKIIIQDNMIIASAAYPAITMYATYKNDPAYNIIVRRNFIYGTTDSGIFAESEVNIENNVIVNSLGYGINFRQRDYDSKVQHIRVTNNTVYGAGADCLALRNGNVATNVLIANNAFIQNAAGKSAMNAYQGLSADVTVLNNVAYGTLSNFSAGITMASSPTALFANPTLALPGSMDFYPKTGSILLDAANGTYAPADDFNLLSRPVGTADIGAYEVHSLPANPGWVLNLGFKDVNAAILPGDFNQDGSVDVIDLLTFADSWTASAGDAAYNPACDLNADGTVDVIDLLAFAENWGTAV